MAENKVEQTSNRWIEGTFKLREEGLKIVCFFLLFFSGFFPAFSFKITLIILYQLNSRNRIIEVYLIDKKKMLSHCYKNIYYPRIFSTRLEAKGLSKQLLF